MINMNDEISADMASYTCQFCGMVFARGSELSLHNKEKHLDEIGSEGEEEEKSTDRSDGSRSHGVKATGY